MNPGETIPANGLIELNEDAASITISVINTSEQAVQVTSHYHFFEANKRLRFERSAAYGRRLGVAVGLRSPVATRGDQRSAVDRH